MNDEERLQAARARILASYKQHNDKKAKRKIIVLTTENIEKNIAFRKRRI
tara:strand:+ start:1755 stop:1904 length:150 start_codon:yes stop_codon:yes gene_type:complete